MKEGVLWAMWKRARQLRVAKQATEPTELELERCCHSVERTGVLDVHDKSTLEVADVELLTKETLVARFDSDYRYYGKDGNVFDPTAGLASAMTAEGKVCLVKVNVWGRAGLEHLPQSVRGHSYFFIVSPSSGNILHTINAVFQS